MSTSARAKRNCSYSTRPPALSLRQEGPAVAVRAPRERSTASPHRARERPTPTGTMPSHGGGGAPAGARSIMNRHVCAVMSDFGSSAPAGRLSVDLRAARSGDESREVEAPPPRTRILDHKMALLQACASRAPLSQVCFVSVFVFPSVMPYRISICMCTRCDPLSYKVCVLALSIGLSSSLLWFEDGFLTRVWWFSLTRVPDVLRASVRSSRSRWFSCRARGPCST